MPPGDEFVAYCVELLSATGPARSRRMFGGHGLYLDERFVGLVARQRLYLKADDATRADFEAARCEPFVYQAAGGRRQVMGFFSAPEAALESGAEMRPWARRALEAAVRAAAQAPTPRRARTRSTTLPSRPR